MIRALTSHKMTATDEKWAVNRQYGNNALVNTSPHCCLNRYLRIVDHTDAAPDIPVDSEFCADEIKRGGIDASDWR